jgi:hypothetical protein
MNSLLVIAEFHFIRGGRLAVVVTIGVTNVTAESGDE